MLRNIRRYIKVLGFLPYDKGSNTIYLKKVYEHKIAYSLLRKVYDTYESNRNRISGKSREAILKEIEDDPDFATSIAYLMCKRFIISPFTYSTFQSLRLLQFHFTQVRSTLSVW